MSAKPSVRYERLRPAQIVARRRVCPVAYLPIGTIEWHGEHNPVGLDTLKIHALLEKCAQEIGGLVFPPLYYGESRLEALMEANAADREQIAEAMALSAEGFRAHQPFTATEQAVNYHKLLLHVLAEVESLGFEVGVLVADTIRSSTTRGLRCFSSTNASTASGMACWPGHLWTTCWCATSTRTQATTRPAGRLRT